MDNKCYMWGEPRSPCHKSNEHCVNKEKGTAACACDTCMEKRCKTVPPPPTPGTEGYACDASTKTCKLSKLSKKTAAECAAVCK